MKIIKIPFSAPLQSWGEDARWDIRSTAARPTKSGIIGFLGCCLGYPRGDERLNGLNQGLRIAIRTDRPGRLLSDFQTVQGTNGVIWSAENKPRSGGGTIITPKHYLQDAWFTVFLSGDIDLLDECFSAMRHPKWTPYLGRKSCAPAIPVVPEWIEAGSLEEAAEMFSSEDLKHCDSAVNIETDYSGQALSAEERIYSRMDNVLHAEKNEYNSRMVKSYALSVGGGHK